MRLRVRVTPRGGRDAIEGWACDAAARGVLKIRVAAPATDGQANGALVRSLATTLRRPGSALRIASGESARAKILQIDDLTDAELAAAVGAPPPP